MVRILASSSGLNRLSRLLAAAALAVGSLVAHAGPVPGQGTWETTLLPRDVNGDGIVDAYYDTALNITWLADWNANGAMNWGTAVAWANSLNIYGVTGWRLPTTTEPDTSCDTQNASGQGYGFNCTGSEMGYLYYTELGNPAGGGLINTANFLNVQTAGYWSATEYAGAGYPPHTVAWFFTSYDGYQYPGDEGSLLDAVAVRPGDVVPEPGSLAMLLVGLWTLAAARRRRPH